MHPQVEKDSLHFKGVGGADKKTFELNMKFLKEVWIILNKYIYTISFIIMNSINSINSINSMA